MWIKCVSLNSSTSTPGARAWFMKKSLTDDAGTLELLHNADIPRKMILFFTDMRLAEDPPLDAKEGDSSNRLAMVHANLSHLQLRVSINDESHFDSPLKLRWE